MKALIIGGPLDGVMIERLENSFSVGPKKAQALHKALGLPEDIPEVTYEIRAIGIGHNAHIQFYRPTDMTDAQAMHRVFAHYHHAREK